MMMRGRRMSKRPRDHHQHRERRTKTFVMQCIIVIYRTCYVSSNSFQMTPLLLSPFSQLAAHLRLHAWEPAVVLLHTITASSSFNDMINKVGYHLTWKKRKAETIHIKLWKLFNFWIFGYLMTWLYWWRWWLMMTNLQNLFLWTSCYTRVMGDDS